MLLEAMHCESKLICRLKSVNFSLDLVVPGYTCHLFQQLIKDKALSIGSKPGELFIILPGNTVQSTSIYAWL